MFFFKHKQAGPIDCLIVGLGNPGKKYSGTRHNTGFAAIEAIAAKLGAKINKVKFKSLCCDTRIGDKRVLLMMPQTYMNLSGDAVYEAVRFYKLVPKQILVLFDDASLPVGTVRVRQKGSDGGQKGVRSIIQRLGSDEFLRIKIGIGKNPNPDCDMAAWVLSRFTKKEADSMLNAINKAAEAACMIAQGDIDGAMNKYSS